MASSKKNIYPLVPVRDIVVFPYMVVPLFIGRAKSIKALEESMLRDRTICLVTQKDAEIEEPKEEDLYNIGTIVQIMQMYRLPDGTIKILVEGLKRAEIVKLVNTEPFFEVQIKEIKERKVKGIKVEALMRSVAEEFEKYIKLNKKVPPETFLTIANIEDPGRFSDIITSHLLIKTNEKQRLLSIPNAYQRLTELLKILTNENSILELEEKIQGKVRKELERTQREYYLREQLRVIQEELGKEDETLSEINEYKEKIKKAKLPKEVEEKALKEVKRLERMPPMAAEGAVVRNYLDWILSLPWNKRTKDRLDIKRAEMILNEDHYGLEKVKERILEYLAVKKLTKTIKGPILCFVGPPGVGKTSLAKSIARSLGRKFVRMSLGGVRDEAEIRGHRRTYVGALPGRIIQYMRQAKSKNPVFLMDEVDKMSTDFRGDPSAALLEVLDPEQNNSFVDHYLEVPFDLSDVMFITTANVLYTIPQPLQDRMEIIHIPGYTDVEKFHIAKQFLIPKQLKLHGLTGDVLKFTDPSIYKIIREYTKEAGVRNLEKNIASICRKVAKEIVSNGRKNKVIKVSSSKIEKYLGPPQFRHDEKEEKDEIGVATGLAWTQFGGEILSVETVIMPGKGKLILTGQLGNVMQESAQAALSYIRSKSKELNIRSSLFEKYDIHIHVPEGAIPKDGPSAGITMATSLVSALTEKSIRKDVAMTGEITLRGKVLPVGGLKEKILAAYQAGIKEIILPLKNKKDLVEIPKNILNKIKINLVERVDEVLNIAIIDTKIRKSRYKEEEDG